MLLRVDAVYCIYRCTRPALNSLQYEWCAGDEVFVTNLLVIRLVISEWMLCAVNIVYNTNGNGVQ